MRGSAMSIPDRRYGERAAISGSRAVETGAGICAGVDAAGCASESATQQVNADRTKKCNFGRQGLFMFMGSWTGALQTCSRKPFPRMTALLFDHRNVALLEILADAALAEEVLVNHRRASLRRKHKPGEFFRDGKRVQRHEDKQLGLLQQLPRLLIQAGQLGVIEILRRRGLGAAGVDQASDQDTQQAEMPPRPLAAVLAAQREEEGIREQDLPLSLVLIDRDRPDF